LFACVTVRNRFAANGGSAASSSNGNGPLTSLLGDRDAGGGTRSQAGGISPAPAPASSASSFLGGNALSGGMGMPGLRNTNAFVNQPLLPIREDGGGGGQTDMFGNRINAGGTNVRPTGGIGRPAPLDRAPSAYLPALGPVSSFQQQRLAPLSSIPNSVPSPSASRGLGGGGGGGDRHDTNGLLEFFGDDALREEDEDDGSSGSASHHASAGARSQQQPRQRQSQKPSLGFTEIDAATAELELQALMTRATPASEKSANGGNGGSGIDRATIDAVREQIHDTLGKFKVCGGVQYVVAFSIKKFPRCKRGTDETKRARVAHHLRLRLTPV
jgi:hypothetical protein